MTENSEHAWACCSCLECTLVTATQSREVGYSVCSHPTSPQQTVSAALRQMPLNVSVINSQCFQCVYKANTLCAAGVHTHTHSLK